MPIHKVKSVSVADQTKTESLSIPQGFWEFLTLKFVDLNSPVWHNSDNLGVDVVPKGQLLGLDIQVREFENKTDYKLLVSLSDGKDFYLLGMGLYTFSALSLVEPICLLPDSVLKSELTFHHQVQVNNSNVFIRLLIQVEGRLLNSPLSSLTSWKKLCFKRVNQVQQKLAQPYFQFESEEDEF
jgi:hypothetical protein